MSDFIRFIREQGVVGLAIGFILGGSISKVVSSLVNDIIQPAIGWAFGSLQGLAGLAWGPVMYGKFVAATLDFVIVSAVVFFIFKRLGIEKLDEKKA